jgi:hypothetical protein
VRADYALSACGQTMVEAADRVAQEDQRATSLFLLLLDGLRTLGRRPDEPATTLDVYLLRLASVAGYHAALDACASCGTPGEHPVFSLEAGGSLCRVCAPPGSQPLTPAVLSALRNLADEGFDAAADTTIDPACAPGGGDARVQLPDPPSGRTFVDGMGSRAAMTDTTTQPHSPDTIDRSRLPEHVGIIMDGNGRWAGSAASPAPSRPQAGGARRCSTPSRARWTSACGG